MSGKDTWDVWYANNKEALAQKRKERYNTDPAYRDAVLQRSRDARLKNRTPDEPDGYAFHMQAASDEVGVTLWALREWRKKQYFPEPYTFKGKKWFTQHQISLLRMLGHFFEAYGVRVSANTKAKLEDLTSTIWSNWGTHVENQ